MNKFLRLLVFAFSLSWISFHAQTVDSIKTSVPTHKSVAEKKSNFSFGVIGGPNFWYVSKIYPGAVTEAGGSGGLDLQYKFGEHSALALNVLQESKSYATKYFYGSSNLNIQQTTIPLMYRQLIGEKGIFFLNAGVFFSNEHGVSWSKKAYDIGSFGINAGLGTRIPLGRYTFLTFEGRENYTLATLYMKTESYFLQGNRALASSTVNLLVGIGYVFGGNTSGQKYSSDTSQRKVTIKPFYAAKMNFRKKQSENPTIISSESAPYQTYSYDSNADVPLACSEGGILLEIPIKGQFNINTGLSFEQRDFTTKETEITFTNVSPFSTTSTRKFKDEVNYRYQFVSLPVFLNYQKKINHSSIYGGIGVEAKALIYSSINFAHEFSNVYTRSGKQENLFTSFFELHAGTTLAKSDRFAFFLEPNIEYGIGTFNVFNSLEMQLWSYGCRAGFRF